MDIQLIAVPYDSGLRGWRMGAGPDHLLGAGAADRLREAGHAVTVEHVELETEAAPEIRAAFDIAARLSGRVSAARKAGALPVILAGNCATAMGTLAGLADARPAILWLDAHADFHTPETTSSGMLDGMALAIATGRCWSAMAASIPGFRKVPERRVYMVGTRAEDEAENEVLAPSAIRVIAPSYVEHLMTTEMDLLREQTKTVYLHIDLDVLNPSEGTANAFSAPKGPTLDHVLALIRVVRARLTIGAAALTAYDPGYDTDGRIANAALTILAALTEPA